MKKFLIIPDLHGRNYWEKFGDISLLIKGTFVPDFDKYIFLGDYCDSFGLSNAEIKHNLLQIIKFREKYPDHVELLWGNHEMHYLFGNGQHTCSGFRPEAWWDLNEIFRKKRLLFKLAYQYENYLFTHAGVHKGWYDYKFKPFDDQKTLGDSLNWAFEQNIHEIFDIGHRRGGMEKVGGPLWLDKELAYKKPLKGYHQIVGHTWTKEIKTHRINDDTTITFCDCQVNKPDMDNLEQYYHIIEC